MPSFNELPAFQPLVLFSCLLVLKMGAVAFATANRRRLSKVVLNPEDTKVTPGAHAEPQEATEVLRAKRAHMNDVENIPGFLALATVFTLAGGSTTAGWAYFGFYFVVRTLHTFFYLNAMQPGRTAMFALGQVAQLGLIVNLLMLAFS